MPKYDFEMTHQDTVCPRKALYCFIESHSFNINLCIPISYKSCARSKENVCVTQRQHHVIESSSHHLTAPSVT